MNVASPTDDEGILDCPKQIRLTEIESQGAPLALNLCQSDFRGTFQNRSLAVGDAKFNILCCWEDFQAEKLFGQEQE